jgi:hypothetical protein
VIILINDFGRDFAADDLGKKGCHQADSFAKVLG